MDQREHILLDDLPRLVAEPLWLRIRRIKHLSLLQQRAGRQPLHPVFLRQIRLERLPNNCNPCLFHILTFKISPAKVAKIRDTAPPANPPLCFSKGRTRDVIYTPLGKTIDCGGRNLYLSTTYIVFQEIFILLRPTIRYIINCI